MAAGVVIFALSAGLARGAGAAPGDLDPAFGTGGKVTTDFGSSDRASAILMQPDGKLVVAGSSGGNAGNFALTRYYGDGTLDTSFNSTGPKPGTVTTDFGSLDEVFALVLQPDGKLVAVGDSNAGGPADFALARYVGTPTPASAVASLNGSAFHTGQTITYQATLIPGSAPTQVDIYLGVLLPDGVTFLSFVPGPGDTTIAFAFGPVPMPFAANVTLTPTVVPFAYTFTGTEPVGTYYTYAGLAVAGRDPLQAANQLSVGVQAFPVYAVKARMGWPNPRQPDRPCTAERQHQGNRNGVIT